MKWLRTQLNLILGQYQCTFIIAVLHLHKDQELIVGERRWTSFGHINNLAVSQQTTFWPYDSIYKSKRILIKKRLGRVAWSWPGLPTPPTHYLDNFHYKRIGQIKIFLVLVRDIFFKSIRGNLTPYYFIPPYFPPKTGSLFRFGSIWVIFSQFQ